MQSVAIKDIFDAEMPPRLLKKAKCVITVILSRIVVVRKAKVPAMMNALLDKAETQFRTRYYIQGLMFEDENITEVKAYAVCFCKNRCAVRMVVGE